MPPEGYTSLTLKDEYLEALDEWRADQRPIPKRTKAIYTAINAFLESEGYGPGPEP